MASMNRRSGNAALRWLLAIIVIAAVVVGVFFVWRRYSTPEVTVTEVVEGPVVRAFYATGTLQPDVEYPIRSNVEGILTEVAVDKGSVVKKGDKIAFVRVEEYQMRHAKAVADLALARSLAAPSGSPVLAEFDKRLQAAQEQLDIAQRELARIKKMREAQSASQADEDRTAERVQTYWVAVESIKTQKETRRLELERDLAVAQSAVDIAKWNLEEQTIKSPTSGSVLDRPTASGTRVKVNDKIMQIADVTPEALVMRAQVDEEDKTRVAVGQKVSLTLYAYAGRVFEAQVKKIYPKADPDRRTFEVDVVITPCDAGFSAGMTGELAFIVEAKEKALVIPSQSVQGGNVWVVKDHKLAKAKVELGIRSIERVEIVSGLAPGDRVVISPIGTLTDGREIRTAFLDAASAAGLNKKPEEKAMRGFK